MLKKGMVLKKSGILLLWGIVLALCVGMAERKLMSQRCEDITVNFPETEVAAFMSKADVMDLINEDSPVLGRKMDLISLSEIEDAVRRSELVKNCEAKKNFSGTLTIDVELYNPVARWIEISNHADEWKKARGFYISEEGKFTPLSNRHSMYVPLISGEYIRNLKSLDSNEGKPYLDLIHFIRSDPFWKAQINQLNVDAEGEVSFLTTLGDQTVEMGLPVDFKPKLTKLKIFYDKVLASDWNSYKTINVKFQDQVVCK